MVGRVEGAAAIFGGDFDYAFVKGLCFNLMTAGGDGGMYVEKLCWPVFVWPTETTV